MLAWWAASLQLSGLRPETADTARQFLARITQLAPHTREAMAYRIAGEVLSQIWPPPPPGAPPQLILAAVLAERHRRELTRLHPPPIVSHPGPTPVSGQPPAGPLSGSGGFVPPN